ncbi:hypothetical protein scyTo_0022582, partial [Scyliorhinus torazame]|nr:hypothetical protein [Scyliorhinus torazame]
MSEVGVSHGMLTFPLVVLICVHYLLKVHLDYCSLYGVEQGCNKDPDCVWCQSRCQSYQQHSACPHVGCIGLAPLLADCQSCLVFGQSRVSPPQGPGLLGWCVQTAGCFPVT